MNGREVREIFLPKGSRILTSQIHCNRDPEIWGPDASEWKPERWLNPLPQSVLDAKIPGIYSNMCVVDYDFVVRCEADVSLHRMTFIAGPRACIGVKFALLEMSTSFLCISALLHLVDYGAWDLMVDRSDRQHSHTVLRIRANGTENCVANGGIAHSTNRGGQRALRIWRGEVPTAHASHLCGLFGKQVIPEPRPRSRAQPLQTIVRL